MRRQFLNLATAIGSLAIDALRRKASLAWIMDDASARAAVLATYAQTWGQGLDALLEAMAFGLPVIASDITLAMRRPA